MGVPAGDAVRAEAFRAYVGRCGAVLWTRAVVLAAGDRAQAGAWWAGALATTYGAWGPDADDAVETHLALRAMSRQAARAGSAAARVGRGSPEPEPEPEPEPAPGAGDGATNVAPGAGDAASNVAPRSEGAPVDPSSRSGGRPPERSAERTWRRLAGLDAPARAALVTACLDEIGAPAGLGLGLREADEPGGVAVSRAAMLLDRRVREVRADLARGLAAWPARTGLAVVAAALREAAQEADPPDAALIDGVLRGDGGVSAAEDRASGSAGGPGRWKRWWRRRRTASRARGRPSRAAVTLVGAVALLGALAGARQLASSAPRDQSPAPQASMADPTPSQARVQLADLPVGAPLHPRTWFHERYVGGRQVFVYADAAGEVPLPTSPAIVGEPAVVALTPRGALLTVAVSDAGPSGRGVGGSRVLAIGADRAVRVVAEGPLVGVTASRDGRWVAYGLTRPMATPQPAGSLPSDQLVEAAVTEVATSTTTTQAATGLPVWAGDRVLVDGVGGPFVWTRRRAALARVRVPAVGESRRGRAWCLWSGYPGSMAA